MGLFLGLRGKLYLPFFPGQWGSSHMAIHSVPVTTILCHGTETSYMLFLPLECCLYSYLPRESLINLNPPGHFHRGTSLALALQIILPSPQVLIVQCVHPHQPFKIDQFIHLYSRELEASWKQNQVLYLCILHRDSTEFNVCLMNK